MGIATMNDIKELGIVSRLFKFKNVIRKVYGEYQLSSSVLIEYIKSQENSRWMDKFRGILPGSVKFDCIWQDISVREEQAFAEAQHAFIRRTHYDQAIAYAKQKGFDTSNRVVQEMLFSGSVQHGLNFMRIIDMWVSLVSDPKQTSNNILITTFYSSLTDYAKAMNINVGTRYEREQEFMLKEFSHV